MEISQLLNFGPIFDDLDSLVHRAKELRTKLNPLKEGHLQNHFRWDSVYGSQVKGYGYDSPGACSL